MSEEIPDNTYNIFRVPEEKIDSLKNELIGKGLTMTKAKKIGKYFFSFYFSKKDPQSPVKWMELYKDFLPNEEERYNRVYFGALIIDHKDFHSYVISLGNAHFYIAKYADSDFGLDLAERIANKEIKEKYTKYFFNNKNQSVIKFRDENDIDDSENGEYFQHIKSSTVNTPGWSWGKYASFGNSVELKLPMSPENLSLLIDQIELELKKPERISIPRVKKIREKDILNSLENSLTNALNNKDSEPNTIIISNKDFLQTENTQYSVYLLGKKGESQSLSEFDLDAIHLFGENNNIDIGTSLDKIRINVHPEYSEVRTEPLKHYVDFITDNYECLLNGKWYKFNTSYVQHIDQLVDKIKIEDYNPLHDFKNADFKNYLKSNTDAYAEEYFNNLRSTEGYINKDRFFISIDRRYTVELLDLYKDKCIFFCKNWNTAKICVRY